MSGLGILLRFDQPVSALVQDVESRLKIPVIDQTGIKKNFEFFLTWDEKM